MKQYLYLSFCLLLLVCSNLAIENNTAADFAHIHLNLLSATVGYLSPPAVARSLSIVSTCMYNAMVPYTDAMKPALLEQTLVRRPTQLRNNDMLIRIAIAESADLALHHVFAADVRAALHLNESTALKNRVLELALVTMNNSSVLQAQRFANSICRQLLTEKDQDGSNAENKYQDVTNYFPVNNPVSLQNFSCETIRSVKHWVPLQFVRTDGNITTQQFATPQFGIVKSFSSEIGPSIWPDAPPMDLKALFAEVLQASATLDDRKKAIVEYWADGPGSALPPGHWHRFAMQLAMERNLTLQQTVLLLFLQSNAVLDAGISCWSMKRFYDLARPITAIRCLYNETSTIVSWKGMNQGIAEIEPQEWLPYQHPNVITPPFSEYVSGHSTFSAASAHILARFFGNDTFGFSTTFASNSSKWESGTPMSDIVLQWPTFFDAAREAGLSRVYGGIHYEVSNIKGQELGARIADAVWRRYCELTQACE